MDLRNSFSARFKNSTDKRLVFLKSLILILIFLNFGAIELEGQDLIRLQKGDIAYNFNETDEEGEEIELESYRGKIVLINFTATYCGPCWKTYNQMDQIQKEYPNRLKIISIHMDEEKEFWEKLANKHQIEFDVTSIWESENKQEIFDIYQANGFPYYVLVDQEGIIKSKWFGNYPKRLENRVRRLVKKLN